MLAVLRIIKKSRIFILLTAFALVPLALCWSRAQTSSQLLKVIDPTTGKEIHTLMLDQQISLLSQLKAARQTNAIEMFFQFRCYYNVDLSLSELEDTVTVLQSLREGQTSQAIQRLEQHLGRYANLMCNSYSCISPTNRERLRLEPLEKTLDYYAKFPPREERGDIVAMKLIVQSKSEIGR